MSRTVHAGLLFVVTVLRWAEGAVTGGVVVIPILLTGQYFRFIREESSDPCPGRMLVKF